MKKNFFLPPDQLNRGYVISAAGFFLYLVIAALVNQKIAGIVAVPFTLYAAYVFLSVSAARGEDPESVGYNLLWGSCALMMLLGACGVLSIKLWFGL